MLKTRRLRGGMLALLLVSGVAGAQTVSTDTPEIAALRVAANAGDLAVQYILGRLYAGNGQIVPKDSVESHKWLNLAASRASAADQKQYAEARDYVAHLMTPTQIEAAQKLAREWLAAFEKRGGK